MISSLIKNRLGSLFLTVLPIIFVFLFSFFFGYEDVYNAPITRALIIFSFVSSIFIMHKKYIYLVLNFTINLSILIFFIIFNYNTFIHTDVYNAIYVKFFESQFLNYMLLRILPTTIILVTALSFVLHSLNENNKNH